MELDTLTPQVIPPVVIDPFNPVLFDSPSVEMTKEQEDAVRSVLLLISSDTNFAQRGASALRAILLAGTTTLPFINSINPPNRKVGSPSFKLTVLGSGFVVGSTILIDGNPVTTLFVSPTEVNTTISLAGVTVPKSYAINVKTPIGLVSNTVAFNATAATSDEPIEKKSSKEVEKKGVKDGD